MSNLDFPESSEISTKIQDFHENSGFFIKFRIFLVLGRKSIDLSFVLLLLRAKCENCDFQCRNRLARDFFRVFTKFSRIFIFHGNFMLFPEKMHLQTYGLGNDFLGNYQTTVGFLAKNADFCVLGLKTPNFVIFMQKLVFAAQITIFRPRSPTINNS